MRHVALCVAALVVLTAAQEEALWIEHFDEKSGRKFYYHEKTRETTWSAPAGVKIKYMDGDHGTSSETSTTPQRGGSAGLVMLSILLPIALPFLGLICARRARCFLSLAWYLCGLFLNTRSDRPACCGANIGRLLLERVKGGLGRVRPPAARAINPPVQLCLTACAAVRALCATVCSMH